MSTSAISSGGNLTDAEGTTGITHVSGKPVNVGLNLAAKLASTNKVSWQGDDSVFMSYTGSGLRQPLDLLSGALGAALSRSYPATNSGAYIRKNDDYVMISAQTGTNYGSEYLFKNDELTNSYEHIPGANGSNRIGYSSDISDNYICSVGYTAGQSVQVFKYNGTTWGTTAVSSFALPGVVCDNMRLAKDDSVVVVGQRSQASGGTNRGEVTVRNRSGDTFPAITQTLVPPSGTYDSQFFTLVDFDGTTIVTTTSGETQATVTDPASKTQFWRHNGSIWVVEFETRTSAISAQKGIVSGDEYFVNAYSNVGTSATSMLHFKRDSNADWLLGEVLTVDDTYINATNTVNGSDINHFSYNAGLKKMITNGSYCIVTWDTL